jgi:TolB protein
MATQCPLDVREAGDPGTPGLGTVQAPLPQGRLLMTVGGLVGPPGIFAIVVLDQDGLHQIDTTMDWTVNGATWESTDTAIFDSEQAGQRHLFRLHLGDASIEQLTSDPTLAQGNASVAPDGRIVHEQWSCVTGLFDGLHVTSADGARSAITEPQTTTDQPYDEQPSVSPDGQSVAFVHQVGDGSGGVFVVPIDGGTITRLTDDASETGRPRWSPDGSTLLFSRDGALWTVPSSGGTPLQITKDAPYRWEADWSPDGTRIVFKTYSGGDHIDLHTADPDGSNEEELWVGDGSSPEQPDWGA